MRPSLRLHSSHPYRGFTRTVDDGTAAAAADPDPRPLLEQAKRAMGTRQVARRLVELPVIPPERAEPAAGTIYALASPEVYSPLVRDRGWSADGSQRWLAEN
jgi:hypothetical protein